MNEKTKTWAEFRASGWKGHFNKCSHVTKLIENEIPLGDSEEWQCALTRHFCTASGSCIADETKALEQVKEEDALWIQEVAQAENVEVVAPQFTETEVADAIETFKSHKAGGVDGMPMSCYKALDSKANAHLAMLLTNVMRGAPCPLS